MANQDISLSLDPDVATVQRNRRLAEQLQQQVADPIQVQSYNGIQAPISPFSVLAKLVRGYGANKAQEKADQGAQAYHDKDLASKQAMIDALNRQVNQVGTPGMAPIDTTVNATAPQLPGGPAPAPQMAPITIPGQQGGGTTQRAPTPQEQLAILLGANGGQETEAAKQTMMPFLQANMQSQMNRENKVWENQNLGLSKADQEKLTASEASQIRLKEAENKLPETAHELAQDQIARLNANSLASYRAAGGGRGGMASLTEGQNQLVTDAISEGRLDPARVNSRTAGLLAGILERNPKMDFNSASGRAALMKNPQYQKGVQSARVLPKMLEGVREAGKKLNYSDVEFLGKVQKFANGQLNDPNFTSYMTKRYDVLMRLAYTMRGVGMSDYATKLEEQAFTPTLSPRALDAYVDAQKEMLGPIVQEYQNFAIGSPGGAAPAAAGAAGNDPFGLRTPK